MGVSLPSYLLPGRVIFILMTAQLTISGDVVRGKGEARLLGYPTANIEYLSEQTPEAGVWIAEVTWDDQSIVGLAVVDMWKQENGLPSVEVHLLDIEQDLYGKRLTLTFKKYVRALKNVASIEELKALIATDVAKAHAYQLGI